MVRIFDLPDDILIIIFKFCLTDEKQSNFLRMQKVCFKWKKVLEGSWFWKEFDGTLPKKFLLSNLRKKNFLKFTEKIILSPGKYTSKELTEIYSASPHLKSVSFEHVKQCDFALLDKNCPNISEIKLGDNNDGTSKTILLLPAMQLLDSHGNNLTILDLSYAFISNLNPLLKKIASMCRNLRELHLHEVKVDLNVTFPLKLFQTGCPKLEVLRLGSPIYIQSINRNSDLPGFPKLKIFTHPCSPNTFFRDTDFINVLSNSPDLRLLDIRGCVSITTNSILDLPAICLETLYLGCTTLDRRMLDIFIKWGRGLRVLDLSNVKCESIDKVLIESTAGERLSNLEQLNLTGTSVSVKALIKLIDNCKQLEILNLTSCRSLGRGQKHEYLGKNVIEELLNTLKSDFVE